MVKINRQLRTALPFVIMITVGIVSAGGKKAPDTSAAVLYLRGVEAGSEVFVNDSQVRQTFRDPIEVGPGYLRLRVLTGGSEVRKAFLIQRGERKIFNMKANPDNGLIDVITEPAGASVSLDEKKAGVTPHLDSLVAPGLHTLLLEKYGYDAISKQINLLSQEELELTFEMKHSTAWLDSVSGAKIRLRKRSALVQRIVYGAIGCIAGGGALYFDHSAQSDISAANTTAAAYDKAGAGFEGLKAGYGLSRDLARKDIDRRNISGAVAAVAAVGFSITFLF
jgi:hypothetical protein